MAAVKASRKRQVVDRIIHETPHDSGRLRRASDFAIYVTYGKSGKFHRHHTRQVRDLKSAGYYVVGVHALADTASPLTAHRLADVDIFRPNSGYDFGSYKAGMYWLEDRLGRKLDTVQSLILMNDSCFGRLTADMMARVRTSDGELVGLFESFERRHHLQSFFLHVTGRPLSSGALKNFIFSYDGETKQDAISSGEIKLSEDMTGMGFRLRSAVGYKDLGAAWLGSLPTSLNAELKELDAKPGTGAMRSASDVTQQYLRIFSLLSSGQAVNPSHFFALEAMHAGVSLVKKELLFHNPAGVPNLLTIWARAMDRDILSMAEALDYMSAEGLDEQTSIWLHDVFRRFSREPDAMLHPAFALEGLS